MIILLLGFFNWMDNNIVGLTHLDLRLRPLIWGSCKKMFLLGKAPWELWLTENVLLQTNINSIILFNLDWASMPSSNPVCSVKLQWSPKTELTSAHLFVSLIWDLYIVLTIIFFLKKNFIYLFIYLFYIYFWLCCVFVSVRGLSLVAASGGHSPSQCAGLFTIAASLVAEHRLQTRRLSNCGSRA